MLRRKLITSKILLVFSLLSILMFHNSCKKVDEALEYALDFDGVFRNSTGWEVTLHEEGEGILTKAGTPPPGNFNARVVDKFCQKMVRQSETIWKGDVRGQNGLSFLLGLDNGSTGTITIDDDILKVNTNSGETYSLNRVAGTSTRGDGGTGTKLKITITK